MTFAQLNLDPGISKAILACGYTIPTPIQARSIPDILLGRDLVASAQTGTGKTAAFVLPALHRLSLNKSTANTRVLILTPTRELAAQITQAASKYGKYLNFNIISLVGGMPYRQQLRDLSRPVDIIVATPGRLLDHMDNKRLNLSSVEMLVLDEADRMLDMGFIDDVKKIAQATPNSRQTLLFSATVDDKLSHVIRHLLKDPVRIDLSNEKMAPTLIKQEIYLADNAQHKNRLLQHFLDNGNIFKAIIFSATKIHADELARQLRNQGYEAAALHGDLKQNVRNKTIEQLRRGKIQFLVATDVAARGIDINDVTHVINYDLPKFSEDYVHRIGRTGRAGKTGIAISLALPSDTRHLQKIERLITQKFELSVVPGLEPTKRFAKNAPSTAPSRKKKFGKSSGGGYGKSGGYAGKSERKGGYAGKNERPASERSSFRSERPSGERSNFGGARSERASGERRSFGGARGERAAGERSSFGGAKRERASGERASFNAARSERPTGERSSFSGARSERPAGERSSFGGARRERAAGERSSFGGARGERSTGEKSRFAGARSERSAEPKSFRGDKSKRGASNNSFNPKSGFKPKKFNSTGARDKKSFAKNAD